MIRWWTKVWVHDWQPFVVLALGLVLAFLCSPWIAAGYFAWMTCIDSLTVILMRRRRETLRKAFVRSLYP